uniref:Putative Major facilitator superfamily MFS_1 transporter n=1 Tax=Magnetococcus massalia (strain MO-1) TaxID=451514 RepID=A0A1S7LMP8_MAGMO|nr:putative Major facilitator superfamily MFS_1 transporter [Candidatus Magnetococcus massalia]
MTSRTYWVISLYYAAFFGALGIWLPYWPLFLEHEGMNPEQIGLLTALTQGARVLGSPVWGHLADRSNRRLVIIATSLGTLGAFSLFYFGSGFWYFALATIIYSFVHAAPLALVDATAMEQASHHNRDYGRMRVWGSIGFIIAAQLVGFLLDFWSILLILPALTLLIGADVLLGFAMPKDVSHEAHGEKSGQAIGVLSDPRLRWLYLSALLMQFSHSGYYGFFSLHMEANGFSRGEIGAFWSLGVLAEVVLMTWSKPLLNRYGASALMMISLILASVRWAVFSATVHWLPIVLVQLLHAFTFGAYHVASVQRLHELAPAGKRASTQAWYSALSFGVGGGLGLAISGYLYKGVGATGLFGVMALAATLGVAAGFRAIYLYRKHRHGMRP